MENKLLFALRKATAISDYQFGQSITDILFEDENEIRFEYSKNTDKIKHIYYKDKLMLNLRPTNGYFTLSLFSAEKIIKNIPSPKLRAIVMNEISDFIRIGRNVFCKHILDIDDNLRSYDEIIVVNQENEILAIGKLVIPVPYVRSFKTGVAIKVRKGIGKLKL
ncbi:MAG: pseudouridine synthase [Candidatus Lokiarchaeota archaeon]|nr:pseudouridine synthase [Candidatus Lokiarchaeota archaeon]